MSQDVIIKQGDCRELLKTLPDNSIESCVTDPPYEYDFMNQRWDGTGIAFESAVWEEVYRVLKPGSHAAIFGADRRIHRLMVALEDAGFEIRCMGFWLSAQSFPKSRDISKDIDKRLGKYDERKVVGTKPGHEGFAGRTTDGHIGFDGGSLPGFHRQWMDGETKYNYHQKTAPATGSASKWEGWGTALKSQEPWVLVRKPLAGGTIADNVLKYGVGGIYIDGCRTPYVDVSDRRDETRGVHAGGHYEDLTGGTAFTKEVNRVAAAHDLGRWPSSIMCSDEDVGEGPIDGVTIIAGSEDEPDLGGVLGSYTKHFRVGSSEDEAIYTAVPEDLLSAILPTGVICSKASTGEREMGCEDMPERWVDPTREEGSAGRDNPRAGAGRRAKRKNTHPTVEPIGLMRHLVRLVTPPGGTVIDPFTGAGSTAVAAVWEDRKFVGFELSDDSEFPYVRIAVARTHYAQRVHRTPEIHHRVPKPKKDPEDQTTFGF